MPEEEPKVDVHVPSSEDDLLPILVIEELVKSDRPMSVDNVSKKFGIGETTLTGHFNALAEEGYIEVYGSSTTFVVSKRLATLATDILTK